MVIGTCLYPSGTTFTPPTAPLTAVTNTALLLGMSNAAIFDNAILNNLETVGSAQISTSVFKYGTGSVAVATAAAGYLQAPDNAAFTLGSGDFTIEMWAYFTASTGFIAAQSDSAGNSVSFFMRNNAGALVSVIRNAAQTVDVTATSSAGVFTTSTWYHVAFVRDGVTTRQYINGVQNGTGNATGFTVADSTGSLVIGTQAPGNTGGMSGYIDDFRFTKGICRYPSGTTFTPPTAAFPNSGP
jgi:hypothetical protein